MHYNAITRRYFDSAPGAGVLIGPAVGRGAAGSRTQGTWVQFDVQADFATTGSPLLAAARFLAFACPHTIAACAWVVEHAVGRRLDAGLPESVRELSLLLGSPVEKLGRLLTVEDAWLAALSAAAARRVTVVAARDRAGPA